MMDKTVERILVLKESQRKNNNRYIKNKYISKKRSFNGHSISDKTPRAYEKKTIPVGNNYQQ